MIDVYRTEGKRQKTYLVADTNFFRLRMKRADHKKLEDFTTYSMRYFKVLPNRLFLTNVWIINDEMYLSNPHTKGAKVRSAICLMNKEIERRIGL